MPRVFRLHIEMDNAAFDPPDTDLEVARILRGVAENLEVHGGLTERHPRGRLFDVNGNSIGSWEVT